MRIKELSDTCKGQSPLGPGFPHSPQDWSLDGRFILFRQRDAVTGRDLWVLPVSGEQEPYALLRTQHNEDDARLSPDGRWVAHVSDESGQHEVYVARFDSPGDKWRISTSGGAEARWPRDGRELST